MGKSIEDVLEALHKKVAQLQVEMCKGFIVIIEADPLGLNHRVAGLG